METLTVKEKLESMFDPVFHCEMPGCWGGVYRGSGKCRYHFSEMQLQRKAEREANPPPPYTHTEERWKKKGYLGRHPQCELCHRERSVRADLIRPLKKGEALHDGLLRTICSSCFAKEEKKKGGRK